MPTAQYPAIRRSHHQSRPLRKDYAIFWLIGVLGLLSLLPSLADAQTLGYVLNAGDGTITIFGSASDPNGKLIESNLQTVPVCKEPTSASLAVVQPNFLATSNPSQIIYVTCADNSLWSVDGSNLGLGAVPIVENINVGNSLQLNLPTRIVYSTFLYADTNELGCSDFQPTLRVPLIFVVNAGNNTVSVIDPATKSLFLGHPSCPKLAAVTNPIPLGPPGTGKPAYAAQIADGLQSVYVSTNFPTPQIFEIPITNVCCNTVRLGPSPLTPVLTAHEIAPNGQPLIGSASSPIYIAVDPFAEDIKVHVILTYSTPQPQKHILEIRTVPGGDPPYVADFMGVLTADLGLAPPVGLFAVGDADFGTLAYTIDTSGILWKVDFRIADGFHPPTVKSFQLAPFASAPTGFAQNADGSNFYVTDGTPKTRIVGLGASDNLKIDQASSVMVGNGSFSPVLGSPDPFSPPVCWLSGDIPKVLSALESQNSISGVCTTSPFYDSSHATTAARAAVREHPQSAGASNTSGPIDCTPIPGQPELPAACKPDNIITKLNMGVLNGQSATCIPKDNKSVSNGSTCTTLTAQQTANFLTASGQFPSSGVFTLTTIGTADSTPLEGSNKKQVMVGANCNAKLPTATVPVGQPVSATVTCTMPLSDQGGVSATIDWGDGTPASHCSGTSPCGTVDNGSDSELVSLSLTHTYNSPTSTAQLASAQVYHAEDASTQVSYSVKTSVYDDAESVSGNLVTPQPFAVNVVPISVPVTPPSATVQGKHSQTFTANVQYDVTNRGVRWALSGNGCAGAFCGTLTNVTTTSVTYTAPATAPSGGVTLTATSLSTNQKAVTTDVAISVVSLIPPTCTSSGDFSGEVAGQSITVAISCTAQASDALTATVDWKDGTTPSTANASANSAGSASFSFTHTYSAGGYYSPAVAISDKTTTISATPPTVALRVYASPTLAPSIPQSTMSIVQGQTLTVPVTFSGGAVDANLAFSSVTCQVSPGGPSCSINPSSLTLDANGNGTVKVTVSTVGRAAGASLFSPDQHFTPIAHPESAMPVLGFGMLFVFLCACGQALQVRRRYSPFIAAGAFALIWLGGCSTFQRSNIGCSGCTVPASYSVTVSATSVKPPLTSNGTFTFVVNQ